MGQKQTKIHVEDIEQYKHLTNFTDGEVRHLYVQFQILTNNQNVLNRESIYSASIGGLHSNPIHPIILRAMFKNKSGINFLEFLQFLNNFRRIKSGSSTSEEDRRSNLLHILFEMYDYDQDGRISREDLVLTIFRILKDHHLIGKKILRIADIMIIEADSSKTGQILFADFCEALKNIDINEKLTLKFPHTISTTTPK